jgi:hypothetical protein
MVLWTLQWHIVSWLNIGWVRLDMVSVEVCLFMLELFQCLIDVIRHREVNLSLLIIPVQSYSNVTRARPIACQFVVHFKELLKVPCMFFANVFNTKVVYH